VVQVLRRPHGLQLRHQEPRLSPCNVHLAGDVLQLACVYIY
jgi:hypothetical protein